MNVPVDSETEPVLAAGRSYQRTATYVSLTKLSDERLSGFEVHYEPSGSIRRGVYRSTSKASNGQRDKQFRTDQPMQSLKSLFEKVRKLAVEMKAYAANNELIDLANRGFALLDALDELWMWRSTREPDWGDLVNLLRTALTKIEFERLSAEQCATVVRFLDECLCSGRADASEHQLGLRLLRKAKLDPWRVLAQQKV